MGYAVLCHGTRYTRIGSSKPTGDVESFHEHFDWPDAVIYLPYGSADMADLIADLERQPERLASIRRNNLVNALRRHDWAYRWRSLIKSLGLNPLTGYSIRKKHLETLAATLG